MPSPFILLDDARPDGASAARFYRDPAAVVVARRPDEVVPALERIEALRAEGYELAGYFAYEAGLALEPRLAPLADARSGAAGPLVWFGAFTGHQAIAAGDMAGWLAEQAGDGQASIGPMQPQLSPGGYEQVFAALQDAISAGDIYQANLTFPLSGSWRGDPMALYAALRPASAAGYGGVVFDGSHWLLSLSPELFFALKDGAATVKPMKGTRPRGRDAAEDAGLAAELAASIKDRSENLMILDLMRNDLSRVSQAGSVKVEKPFAVESYPTVHQMVSTVRAQLLPGRGAADMLRALFPCGSITGAPKLKAMDIISELEQSPRGVYCGAIGHIAPGGAARFNVAIRTVTLDAATGDMECGLGGGITWDSAAEDEYAEVQTKSRFLARAAGDFELLETLLLEDGHYTLLERHLSRLASSASHFGFTSPEAARAALEALAQAHPHGRLRVRLLCAANGSVRIDSTPAGPPEQGIRRVRIASAPVSRAEPFLYHKTTRRSVYDAHMSRCAGSAFDVLLWNDAGELTEFTRGNLVLDIGGQRVTPPVSSGLLDGTLRRELVESGALTEQVLTRDDLARANAIWFINSLRGWVAVSMDESPLDIGASPVPAYADPYAGDRSKD